MGQSINPTYYSSKHTLPYASFNSPLWPLPPPLSSLIRSYFARLPPHPLPLVFCADSPFSFSHSTSLTALSISLPLCICIYSHAVNLSSLESLMSENGEGRRWQRRSHSFIHCPTAGEVQTTAENEGVETRERTDENVVRISSSSGTSAEAVFIGAVSAASGSACTVAVAGFWDKVRGITVGEGRGPTPRPLQSWQVWQRYRYFSPSLITTSSHFLFFNFSFLWGSMFVRINFVLII